MSIDLALADAANNCHRENATAILTLKSGVQVMGRLARESGADLGTIHLRTKTGGWATVLTDELAMVAVEPAR